MQTDVTKSTHNVLRKSLSDLKDLLLQDRTNAATAQMSMPPQSRVFSCVLFCYSGYCCGLTPSIRFCCISKYRVLLVLERFGLDGWASWPPVPSATVGNATLVVCSWKSVPIQTIYARRHLESFLSFVLALRQICSTYFL